MNDKTRVERKKLAFDTLITKTAAYQRHILRFPIFFKKAFENIFFLEKTLFFHQSF